MIEKYKILRDEWINLVFEEFQNKNISEVEACKRIIKVHEIFHFRQLKDKLVGGIVKSRKNNLSSILDNLRIKRQSQFIIYATDLTNPLNAEDRFYVITIDILRTEYQLDVYSGWILEDKVNIWRKLIKYGADQDKCLSFLENILNLNLLNTNRNGKTGKVLVIPNQLLIDIPFGLLRKDRMFYYDNYESEYWPSLNLVSQIKRNNKKSLSASVFFDHNEQNAKKEAKIVKEYVDGDKCNIEKIDKISHGNADSNILHFIFHFDGRNALINGEPIHYTLLFQNIDVTEKVIILNICQGGKNVLKSNTYNSLPTYFISRGADAVISHNWELGQEASLTFTNSFYMNLKLNYSISTSFNESLRNLGDHSLFEYGGYTLWGNGKVEFS